MQKTRKDIVGACFRTLSWYLTGELRNQSAKLFAPFCEKVVCGFRMCLTKHVLIILVKSGQMLPKINDVIGLFLFTCGKFVIQRI